MKPCLTAPPDGQAVLGGDTADAKVVAVPVLEVLGPRPMRPCSWSVNPLGTVSSQTAIWLMVGRVAGAGAMALSVGSGNGSVLAARTAAKLSGSAGSITHLATVRNCR